MLMGELFGLIELLRCLMDGIVFRGLGRKVERRVQEEAAQFMCAEASDKSGGVGEGGVAERTFCGVFELLGLVFGAATRQPQMVITRAEIECCSEGA